MNLIKRIEHLAQQQPGTSAAAYDFMLAGGEQVLFEFQSVRDMLVVTDRRLITVDVQGITGKKRQYYVLPFSKITAYAVETAGTFDLDVEFTVWASGVGSLQFELARGADVRALAAALGANVG